MDERDVRIDVNGEDDDKEESYWHFHLVMFLGSMYISMLLTDWGNDPATSGSAHRPEGGRTAMWVKIVCEWLTIAIYTWTLVAPRCCPGRTFD